MSRMPRFSYPQALHHVTLRCNNREFLFADESFRLFCEILQAARARFALQLYNYCLMTNHVHLVFKVPREDTLSKAMHWTANTFSRRFNKMTGRIGHLWEGRFRSTIIEEDSYFFRCMAYVDLNPIRAGLAATPLDYPWSGHFALRSENKAELDFHPLYLGTGPDAASRYAFYAELLAEEGTRSSVPPAREYFVGTPRFINRMVQQFGLDKGRYLRRRQLAPELECVGPRLGRAIPMV